ncbi:glycosyl transferase [Moraxella osloensis]|uniref:Glycosyl transferase n=1 Tax=Faucicola osloensis TaxID=34062 RepID=A0A2I1RGS1_FAUOS|nr:glycosyltransferase [Moraxella osloensis]PKZ68323.1 glycosyl transferase [Moraxella osloensis]
MVNPLVSIVIPCYNHESFVQDCIQSVIDQTYQNIELIIIDDGSKDNSVAKIQEMISACKVRFTRFEFRTRANKGLSATLNEALEWCQGSYYSAIASDDMLLQSKIAIQVEYLENPNNVKCAGVFGNVIYIDNNSDYLRESRLLFKRNKFEDIFLQNYSILAPTQLLRLDLVRKVGYYDEDVKIEDYYMWLKLTFSNKFHLDSLEDCFVKYRAHETNSSNNSQLMHEERLKVLRNYKELDNYEQAISLSYLMYANEILKKNRNTSLKIFRRGFLINKKIIFKRSAVKYLMKLAYGLVV